MVRGAPAASGVGPESSFGDSFQDGLHGSVGAAAGDGGERELVVGGVFGGELDGAVPFGFAEVGVDDGDPVPDSGGVGGFDDFGQSGAGVGVWGPVTRKVALSGI